MFQNFNLLRIKMKEIKKNETIFFYSKTRNLEYVFLVK